MSIVDELMHLTGTGIMEELGRQFAEGFRMHESDIEDGRIKEIEDTMKKNLNPENIHLQEAGINDLAEMGLELVNEIYRLRYLLKGGR